MYATITYSELDVCSFTLVEEACATSKKHLRESESSETAMLMIFEDLPPKDLENNDISGFNAFNFEF